jgi:aconitate hydratase
MSNPFGTKTSIDTRDGSRTIYSLAALEKEGIVSDLGRLPVSIRILLEQVLRNYDGKSITEKDIQTIAGWSPDKASTEEIPFCPTRVILQDFTGVPAVVDLASLRTAMVALGGDPAVINPRVPVDLVIDHSVQVDHFGQSDSLSRNMQIEFERNKERYEFLKWGQSAFQNFGVVPPGMGIVHQVNLEYLAQVVADRDGMLFPDTLVGTDSHTTMINGLGVLGWGVGGIEAESVMLGQAIYMLLPEVVGFRLTGSPAAGTTATDLVLRVVEMLREKGVVGKFVEFYGPGLDNLTLADRATLANMGPEYGATMGFCPVDDKSLDYLRLTGRSDDLVDRVERYLKEQGLFRTSSMPDPSFSATLELDMGTVEPALAGPKRPQDRINLKDMKSTWHNTLRGPVKERGFAVAEDKTKDTAEVKGSGSSIGHGAVAIAAITSCTNTSNPGVLIAAGLLAQKAVAKGLKSKPWVKTSLAPGSRVVTDYLDKAGLSDSLNELGFETVGYGCTTCIGNSGPVPDDVREAIHSKNLVATSVLSGNRNFEGRISPDVKANYLASPPLVVAYAIAGTTDIDLTTEPLAQDQDGKDVFLKDIWPSGDEIQKAMAGAINPEMFRERYTDVEKASDFWNQIPVTGGQVFEWQDDSTYIQNPPFFQGMTSDVGDIENIEGARCLVKVGDSVTTDHISPAGSIASDTPAGKYLQENGVEPKDFNSYGSRRGNDRVMTRGTFANIRLRNQMAPGTEGGYTRHVPSDEQMFIYDANLKYRKEETPLIVLAGKEYGTGSSRDWAAKGTFLLGVKAVVAESYERIHRSNLIGMGVLPLQFKDGNADSHGLTGKETFSISGLSNDIKPMQDLILKADGKEITVQCRLDTEMEIEYYRNGGILHTVLRGFIREGNK